MRSYKFRAWDGKKMQYDFNIDCEGEIFILELEYHEIMQYFKPNWILMQFTGITDKEGVEIFEGDIIEYTQHMFNTEKTRVERKEVKWNFDRWNIYETNAGESDIKVIGNIYENPKLLK